MDWLKKTFSSLPLFGAPEPVREIPDGEVAERCKSFIDNLCGNGARNMPLYITALTHRSATRENSRNGTGESNQRLEFLGDAVLDLVISEYLYGAFPDSPEGELSGTRAKIVNRKSLAAFARTIGLGEALLIGESAGQQNIRESEGSLADAFEALTGAIYLDRGIEAARSFLTRHIIHHEGFTALVVTEQNHKSRLIEYTQANRLSPPLYTIVNERGVEHQKTFTIEVSCQGKVLGSGTAQRKKDAEQLAAREAMELLASEQSPPEASPT